MRELLTQNRLQVPRGARAASGSAPAQQRLLGPGGVSSGSGRLLLEVRQASPTAPLGLGIACGLRLVAQHGALLLPLPLPLHLPLRLDRRDPLPPGVDLVEFSKGSKGVDPRARGDRPLPDVKALRAGWLGHRTKLLIGAVNGPAVTGGLELALNCDFLIASPQASFADTHARVGIMPGWGLTVLLPQFVGVARARQMSVTGDYVSAATALAWGLVNEVVPQEELLPRACALARTAAKIKAPAVEHLLATYAATTGGTAEAGWLAEQEFKRSYAESDRGEVGKRYADIRTRGAAQQTSKL